MIQPPKPWRGPKKQEDMDRGRKARRRGKVYQKKIAEFLGMDNRWPLPGIDIEGKHFCVSAKSREEGFPQTVENWLQEAEIMTLKKRPEAIGILIIHNTGDEKRDERGQFLGVGEDLVVMRAKDFKWLKEGVSR